MNFLDIDEDYSQIFDTYSEVNVEPHINKFKELDQFYPKDSTFFCITNTVNQSFEYVSKNFSCITGYESSLLYDGGMPFYWSLFHPDDLPLWLDGLKTLMSFTLTETDDFRRSLMSYTWNYRIKNKKGIYVNVIQNTTPIEFDNNKKPIVGLAHYTILDQKVKMDICTTVKLFNSNDEYETIFFKNFSQKHLLSPLSNRERDISRLLIMDKSSLYIAKALGISKNTVDTHRRNILKKLNLKSTTELKVYFRENTNFI